MGRVCIYRIHGRVEGEQFQKMGWHEQCPGGGKAQRVWGVPSSPDLKAKVRLWVVIFSASGRVCNIKKDLWIYVCLYVCIYSFEKSESEREIFHPVPHSLNTLKARTSPDEVPGVWNSIQISHVGDRGPCTRVILLCLPKNISEDLDWKQNSQDLSWQSVPSVGLFNLLCHNADPRVCDLSYILRMAIMICCYLEHEKIIIGRERWIQGRRDREGEKSYKRVCRAGAAAH